MEDIGKSESPCLYYPVSLSSANGLGDFDDEFPPTPIELAGLVDYFPSPVTRAAFGQDTNFECTVRLHVETLSKEKITIQVGDRFRLPGTQQDFYVTGLPQPIMQAADTFLEVVVPLSKKSGRRG